jgi:adenylate cyclase
VLQRLKKSIGWVVPLLILAFMVSWRIYDPGYVLEDFRFKVFDYFQRFAPREYKEAETKVRIVDLDDESLEKIGQWPWPRSQLAEMVVNLTNAGAAVIAFDIVFSEPDRTSPKQMLPLWKQQIEDEADVAKLEESLKSVPDPDEMMADIVKQAPVVTGFVLTLEKIGRRPVSRGTFARAGDDPSPFLPVFGGAVPNLEILERAAKGNGSFNMVAERDQVVRRVPMVMCLIDSGAQNPCPLNRLYPGLSTEAIRVAQGARTNIIKASGASGELSFGANAGINNVKVGNFVIPTDPKGQMWVHYTRDVPKRYIPAWKVLAGEFDEKEVDGSIIFVGTSASGLKDLRVSPINATMAGVEAHVQAAEQILLGHFLNRPDVADGAELLFMALFGIVLVFLVNKLGAGWSAFVAAASIAGAFGASWYAYIQFNWLTDPVTPTATVLAIFLTATIINYLRTEAEKKYVRGAMAQYMSPALVEKIAENPGLLKLGGETRNMTFLFCDVRGFTTISEQFKTNPQGLTRLINRFLTPLTDVIMANEGTIDKYMGDCIMAFWNAPLDVNKHPCRAAESALEMFVQIDKLNIDLKAEAEAENRPFYPINIGIGLNSGDVVVGNMGSTQRFDYSVLGDAVNLASRLEGQSKTYGVGVVIGDTTYEVCKDEFATIELDLIAVKGKKEAVRIHALLGDLARKNSPEFQAYFAKHHEFLALYRAQEWDAAEAMLAELREMDPKLYGNHDLYQERIDEYRQSPPGEGWTGVYVATSK